MAIFNTFWATALTFFVLGGFFGEAVYQFVKHGAVGAYQSLNTKIFG